MAGSTSDLPVWLRPHVAGTGPGYNSTAASLLAAAGSSAGHGGSPWWRTLQAALASAASLAARGTNSAATAAIHPRHADRRNIHGYH